MVRQSQASPDWLDPEKLIEFIDELRGADYNIGVSQYIAVQDLIVALSAQGERLDQPQRLKSLIGPLLCSSPAEQEDFQQRFDQWIKRMEVAVSEAAQEDKKLTALRQEFKKIERRSQWFRWGLAVIAILIAIGLIYVVIRQLSPLTPDGVGGESDNGVKGNGQDFPWERLLPPLGALFLLPFVIFRAWQCWRFWTARQYLKRHPTRKQPEIQRVSLSGLNEELFPNVLFLRIAQSFRRRIRVPANELSVQGTIEETVRRGGWFTPIYGYRQVLPEYLILIDRANYGDHQAAFVREMIDRLTQNEVFITGYYFDSDPCVCFPMAGKGSPCRLREIAAKYSHHRLVVFSDAEGFFSSLTGELKPWSELFSSWSERAVLTPKPSEHWGYQELELSREFIVLPATPDGLINLVGSIQNRESPYLPSEESRAPFPETLKVRSRRWIEQDPPELWLVKGVLNSLRCYLGEAGYYWLSACAVFPELHWNLTVYLGNTLRTEDGKSLLQVCQLTDLARLPWFRYGYMPDWLRSWLIYELPRYQELNVRSELQKLLTTVPDEKGVVGRLQLEIVQQHSNAVSMLAHPLLRLLSREASENRSLREYIFQGFMSGRKRLSVRMPKELREYLRRKYPQKVGWGGIERILATVLGFAMGGVVLAAVGGDVLAAVGRDVLVAVGWVVLVVVAGGGVGITGATLLWLLRQTTPSDQHQPEERRKSSTPTPQRLVYSPPKREKSPYSLGDRMSYGFDFSDSLILITSTSPENKRNFGTGFVVYHDESTTYVFTCAHVVRNVGGTKAILADGNPAQVIASREDAGFDLAVLRVEGLLKKPRLNLQVSSQEGRPFIIGGFYQYDPKVAPALRSIEGTLGEQVQLTSLNWQDRINAWDLNIVDEHFLKPSYSGAPVIDKTTGHAFAIVSHLQGRGEKGLAISVEAVEKIWLDVLSLKLLSRLTPTPQRSVFYSVYRLLAGISPLKYLKEVIRYPVRSSLTEHYSPPKREKLPYSLGDRMSYGFDFSDSLILITSTSPENKRNFGTGFVVYHDESTTYVFTCAHVVRDVGGTKAILADGNPAQVIASGEDAGFDLAVLRVEGLLKKPRLSLQASSQEGRPFIIGGFYQYDPKVAPALRSIEGTLGEQVQLTSLNWQDRINAWDLNIVDEHFLKPGYSGAPVVDKTTGHAFAIVSHRQGRGEKGLAISVEAVEKIWLDVLLPGLISKEPRRVPTKWWRW